MDRACAGARISSGRTSSATFRNSGRASRPRRASAPGGADAHFFRTAAAAEIDLLLTFPGRRKPWAIEIKRGLAPQLERGFHLACDAVRPERRLVVYGGTERIPLAEGVEALALADLCDEVAAA